MAGERTDLSEEQRRPRWRRFLPLAGLIAALGAFFALGLHRYVSVELLRDHREALVAWTNAHPLLAGLACMAVSAALMAMAFPSIGVVMAAAGLVLGLWEGFALTLIGATAGGTILFLAARGARDAMLNTAIGPILRRLRAGAEGGGFLYLLSLRLMPIFPTATVTLAAAAARLKVRDFVLATLLGAAPASFIFTSLGAGAGAALEEGGDLDLLGAILRPDVLAPMLGLAVLAFAAAWLKARNANRA